MMPPMACYSALMMKPRMPFLVLGLGLLCSSACTTADLTPGKAKSLIEAKPVELAMGFVGLTDSEVSCALSKGLLETAGTTLITTDQAEKLGIRGYLWKAGEVGWIETREQDLVGKQEVPLATTTLSLVVDKVSGISDAEYLKGAKIATASVRVKIPHACFQRPLPVYFRQGGNWRDGSFRFKQFDDGWRVEVGGGSGRVK